MVETAKAIYHAFTMPGHWLLAALGHYAPQTREIMLAEHGSITAPFLLSLLFWTVVLVTGLLISRMCRNFAWQVAAIYRTFVWRMTNWLHGLKTRVIWKWREFFPPKDSNAAIVSQEEFDNVDIAVLRTLFKQGPGMAISAPDLAEQLNLRPAQIQHRLENLAHYQMLRSVIGSTDGFDNYRLTDSGLAFITMMQRQARVTPTISPVSASGPG